MIRLSYRVPALTMLVVALLRPAMAHASSVPRTLRYQFTSGQIITYRLTDDAFYQQTLAHKAQPAARAHSTQMLGYQFGTVGADGTVRLTIHFYRTLALTTQGGKTTRSTPAVGDQHVDQEANGQQVDPVTGYSGGYALYDFGIVPTHPLQVGSTWTATIGNTVDILGGTILCSNVLTALSGNIATIATHGTITGPSEATTPAGAFKGLATETLQGTWHFDAQHGRFLGERLTKVVTLTGTVLANNKVVPYQFDQREQLTMLATPGR